MSFGKIYAVDDIDITLLKSKPPSLYVAAIGRAIASGWNKSELSEYVYLTPPADGVQEFDFIAQRPAPGSVVLPVLTPIRAEATLPKVDLPNFWGPGRPLLGVRVRAVSNAKIALFDDPTGMHALTTRAAAMSASYHSVANAAAPSFEKDIKPLFRSKDINAMRAIAGWRLDVYEDVRANASGILQHLKDEDMPCDGPWPPADVDLFEKWTGTGMQA